MKKIIFICVNFNNYQYTEKFIISLSQQASIGIKFELQIIVIDNSTDVLDSVRIRKFCSIFKWISYIKSDSNLGYFHGLNIGIQSIYPLTYDHVIICNNDLVFDSMFCSLLCDLSIDKNIFALCPDIISRDGLHQNPLLIRRPSLLFKLKMDFYFSNYYFALISSFFKKVVLKTARLFGSNASTELILITQEIHSGLGACYILSPIFLDSVKTLYYPSFLFSEETCLSAQIHLNKGILMFVPQLKVFHDESASLSKMPSKIKYGYGKNSHWLLRHLM